MVLTLNDDSRVPRVTAGKVNGNLRAISVLM